MTEDRLLMPSSRDLIVSSLFGFLVCWVLAISRGDNTTKLIQTLIVASMFISYGLGLQEILRRETQ